MEDGAAAEADDDDDDNDNDDDDADATAGLINVVFFSTYGVEAVLAGLVGGGLGD